MKQQQTLKKPVGAADAVKKNYEFIPRPFRAHMIDIERRRKKKFIDFMNSPDEVYPTSENDKRVKFSPQGTLIFHILELYNLSVNKSCEKFISWMDAYVGSLPISFYCVLSIGPLRRTSKIVHSITTKRIRVDYTANFSIEIPEWRESPLNRFTVEIWSYQDPEMHYIVGSVDIHTYEFIRKQHAVERLKLRSDGIGAGRMYCEYSFSYGYFGYGHSNYLKNPKNPIMETACHSMYPRIRIDPSDLVDKVYRIRLPEQLKVFTFNSLIMDVTEAVDTESARKKKRLENIPTKTIILQQVSFEEDKPIHCKLHMNIYQKELQPDFNDMFGEFICFPTRKARLEYLSSVVPGRMRDLYEDEAGTLFKPFKEKEAEKIQKSEINHPGYLVHPTRLPCTKSWGTTKLTNEDETFLSSFPAVRRGQGYLSTVLGFDKRPEPSAFLNDMDAPLYKEAGRNRRRSFNFCRWLRKKFLSIAAFFSVIINFIFPEVREPRPVPEISVTTPTPPGSTAKVYTYFVKDSKDLGVSKLDKLQSQTEALIQLAERPIEEADANSPTSSSSSEEDDREQLQLTKAESIKRGRRDVRKSFSSSRTSNTSSNSAISDNQPVPGALLVKQNFPPISPDFTGPGGHFKKGINQPIL